jgi:hypothetical protein
MRERDHWWDLSVDGKIILKLILKIGCKYVDGIDVTHDGDSVSCCV